ncbi:MAG: YchF-related putative GTPase [Candidatus Parvarchaeota archaeon]|nr:YchF-related putative GTPase [Candidatus Parvarchaeota archaeon]
MKIGIIGRTNVGKSTLFKAMTLEDVKIEDRPFTTIDPNHGVGYATVQCPEKEFGMKCVPHNSPCIDGIRFVPLEVIDVAGLISGASEGKGLGNKFLSDAMEADALIEVIDISGTTDSSGFHASDYDPGNDIEMVTEELTQWIATVIRRANFRNGADIVESIYKNLSGLKFSPETIKEAVKTLDIHTIDENTSTELSSYILKKDKPMIIACNKMDITPDLDTKLKDLKKRFDYTFIPCSAAAELTLKEAHKHGFISYSSERFRVLKDLTPEQKNGLNIIENIIKTHGSTGVQNVVNTLLFDLMGSKVIFTVEDEKKLTDGRGRALPDAYIVDKEATPKDVAGLVHSEVAAKYKGAIDCRSGLKIKNDDPVKTGQILKILT